VQFEAELRGAKLEVHALRPRFSVIHLLGVLLLFPVALVGAIVSYPTYFLVDVLAKRFAKGEGAVTATIKVLAAFAFYPLTYLGLAIVAGAWLGWIPGVVTALVLPFTAYVALRVFEDIDDIIGDLRGLVANREQLLAKRQAIRDEIVAIEREI
jgi:hypothetical protein